jgi:hypothetical protein
MFSGRFSNFGGSVGAAVSVASGFVSGVATGLGLSSTLPYYRLQA